jgi:C4-dicarboxylate transporter
MVNKFGFLEGCAATIALVCFIYGCALLICTTFLNVKLLDGDSTKRTYQVGDIYKTYSCVRIQRIQK